MAGTTWDGGATTWDSGLTLWDGATATATPAGSYGTQKRILRSPQKKRVSTEQELQQAADAIQALANGITEGTPTEVEQAAVAVEKHVSVDDTQTKLAIANAMVEQGAADLQQAWATMTTYYEMRAKHRAKRLAEEEFFLLYL